MTGDRDATAHHAPRPRKWTRWIAPVLGLTVCLSLSYGAYWLAGFSWDQVVSYESPYTTMSGADFSGTRPSLTDPIPGATSRRVVLVVIDGLRDDASRTMTSIEELRVRGADVRLTVPEPSLSYPAWTTIMTGAPPQISGVTTNWFEGPVKIETLLDVAARSGRSVIVSGPKDLDEMFSASEVATASALIEWDYAEYRSAEVVDNALALDARVGGGDLVFVLLPDIDNAGHDFGGSSPEYAEVVRRVDADLRRLIYGLDDGATTFIVLPDHGHTDSGGHGGWEEPVVRTFAALAGPGVKQSVAEADLADIAPTVAVLAGLQGPLQGTGTAIDEILADTNGRSRDAEFVRSAGVTLSYIRRVLGDGGVADIASIGGPEALPGLRQAADTERLADERLTRLPYLVAAVVALVALLAGILIASRRALFAVLAGAVGYTAVYNLLFFGVHRLRWSLSAFNSEDMLQAFFNQRMIETVIAALAACGIAALVYVRLRAEPKGPHAGYTAGWIGLGVATVLVSQLVLLVQVGVFTWLWGPSVSWILPDMGDAFKYDLDLIQMTALGAAALLGPALTWAIGRFHPRSRVARVTSG